MLVIEALAFQCLTLSQLFALLMADNKKFVLNWPKNNIPALKGQAVFLYYPVRSVLMLLVNTGCLLGLSFLSEMNTKYVANDLLPKQFLEQVDYFKRSVGKFGELDGLCHNGKVSSNEHKKSKELL